MSCTSAAITRINAMVCKYSTPSATSAFCTHQVMTLATPITKVTASPIPRAVSVFLETPRNGHIPRN